MGEAKTLSHFSIGIELDDFLAIRNIQALLLMWKDYFIEFNSPNLCK